MKKIDELKKWLNELNSHYASLQKMKALLPQDRNYWDAYNSVMTKITEIEASEISSSAVLKVTSDSKENNKESEVAVAFAEWLFAQTDWRTKNFKELYEMFEKQKAKATDF